MKSKTIAVWLTLIGGPFGLHRWYLSGRYRLKMLLPCIPSGLGIYGIWRMQVFGVDDTLATMLIPLLGLSITWFALLAIHFGLMTTEKWNQKYNHTAPGSANAGATQWMTVAGLVLALMLGATTLVGSIAFSFQHLFEYQMTLKERTPNSPGVMPAGPSSN
jgi:uncharacterized membrane protein